MNQRFTQFHAAVEDGLENLQLPEQPSNLYQPISYLLGLGGKRIRPILTLYGAALFDAEPLKALPQALAVEVFHNFTLVHDDIMDQADLRRGKQTVHKKWDESIAILSGDAMMVKAYQMLVDAPLESLPSLLDVFSTTAIEVCEGQQLDMDYAQEDVLDEDAYWHMIKLKTAVLLSAALRIGAIRVGRPVQDLQALHEFAINTGLAFQMKDDYLDAFGDASKVGKQSGGDIREGKRTWMTIKAMHLANEEQKQVLREAYQSDDLDQRVERVMAIYRDLGIDQLTQTVIKDFSSKAEEALTSIDGDESVKSDLRDLVRLLMNRTN